MYRDNGKRVSVYNEGLTVFLYDESNLETVRKGWDTSWYEGAESPTLMALARTGTLVMYELYQDDPIDVEIAVGEPLTAEEKKPAKWTKLNRALIDLPTGKMCIETGATFPYGEDSETGAIVELPPGKYELTLHRVNWAKMEGKKYDDYNGPHEVITLKPWPARKVYNPRFEIIPYGDMMRVPFAGRYEIKDGVFYGEVISSLTDESEGLYPGEPGKKWRRLNFNLDMQAFNALGLKRGMRLELTAAGRKYILLSQGEMIPFIAEQFLGRTNYEALANLHPMLLVGFLSNSSIGVEPAPFDTRGRYRAYDYFVAGTFSKESDAYKQADDDFNRLFQLQAGAPVQLRVLPEPFFEIDESIKDRWRKEGSDLHCRVVSCNEYYLYLNVGLAALQQIGFEDGDTLELTIGETRRKIFDKTYLNFSQWSDLMEKEMRPIPPEHERRIKEIEQRKKEFQNMMFDEHGNRVYDLNNEELAEHNAIYAEHERLKYHPEDLKNPPLQLGFEASRDFRGWEIIQCKSALYEFHGAPRDIFINAEPNTPAVLRKV
jgi:hypothetical protein